MNEDEFELSDETTNDLQKSREEYKKGNVYTLEETKKSFII